MKCEIWFLILFFGMDGRWMAGNFVLRTTSVSPLDRDKDTLSLTRENADTFFRNCLMKENLSDESGCSGERVSD